MRKSYLEQSDEPRRTSVKVIGVVLGVMAVFLVSSCFIRCPQYMMVESRMTYEYDDSLGAYLTGVAYIKDRDLPKLEVGMPIFYRFTQCQFEGCIADLTPKYDPMMRMKSVRLHFGPDEKVHPIYINGYGVPGKLRLSNPTLFECIFLRKKK